jgi:hypothetical protein
LNEGKGGGTSGQKAQRGRTAGIWTRGKETGTRVRKAQRGRMAMMARSGVLSARTWQRQCAVMLVEATTCAACVFNGNTAPAGVLYTNQLHCL